MTISYEIFKEQEFYDNYTSVHTRESYKIDLRLFHQYLLENHPQIKNLKNIKRDHIVAYRNWLTEFGGRDGSSCAPKTIARKLSSISSYFDYLVEKNLCAFNPATSVKRPRHEVKTPTQALTREQVEELFAQTFKNKNSGPLHRALLITFFTSGLRKNEVLLLKYRDYREINNYRVLEYSAKGGKIGQKVLHPMCIEAIDEYLDWMKKIGRKHVSEDWLFQPTRNPHNPKNLNKPLNPRTINEILEHYSKKIGLNFKTSPHSARATFIGELLDQGVDIYSVAREVGHSSVKTTQEYDKRRKNFSNSPVFSLKYGS